MRLTSKQERVKAAVEYLQNYMNTYDKQQTGYLDYSDETIIHDVVYGLGVALDKKYEGPAGYREFKRWLITMLWNA